MPRISGSATLESPGHIGQQLPGTGYERGTDRLRMRHAVTTDAQPATAVANGSTSAGEARPGTGRVS